MLAAYSDCRRAGAIRYIRGKSLISGSNGTSGERLVGFQRVGSVNMDTGSGSARIGAGGTLYPRAVMLL